MSETNDISPTDKYILKAQGKLDGYQGYVNYISNPDLPLGSQKNISEWEDEIRVLGNRLFIRGSLTVGTCLTPLTYIFLDSGPRDVNFFTILAFAFVLSVLAGAVVTMFALGIGHNKYERKVLENHGLKAASLMWEKVPDEILTAYRLQEESLYKLRALAIDSDLELACNDLQDEMQLLLRRVKASEDRREQDILSARAQELVVETTALAYAWQDRIAAEQASVEQALEDTGVNVRALIERALEPISLLTSNDEISSLEERGLSERG